MKLSRREIMKSGLAGLGAIAVSGGIRAGEMARPETHSFHHDHILGTSLDMWLVAPNSEIAAAAESVALGEIERLRGVFSLHDSQSELSCLNRSTGSFACSADLFAVLQAYGIWHERTSGACNPQLGELHALWSSAAAAGREPDSRDLAAAAFRAQGMRWKLDESNRVVEHAHGPALDLNSIAKGYILQRAADALRTQFPAIECGLLNLGGDMLHWGASPARIGVQDPFNPEDNRPPRAWLRLKNASVATSGGYLRGYNVGGNRYSHILDPRTGRPANGAASATVVAADSVTANLLATTLCVLPPDAGLKLAAAAQGTECLIVARDGREFRSAGFNGFETETPEEPNPGNPPAPKPDDKKAEAGKPWQDGYQVNVSLNLPQQAGRARRPYVAVWLEDAKEKAVRTLVVWGNAPRWLPELSGWFKFARNDKELVAALTRATRGAGKYDIVWDGKDDRGRPLPQGVYTVKIEVHREHGKHVYQTGKIACGAAAEKLTLEKNDETGETTVTYSKKTEPGK